MCLSPLDRLYSFVQGDGEPCTSAVFWRLDLPRGATTSALYFIWSPTEYARPKYNGEIDDYPLDPKLVGKVTTDAFRINNDDVCGVVFVLFCFMHTRTSMHDC